MIGNMLKFKNNSEMIYSYIHKLFDEVNILNLITINICIVNKRIDIYSDILDMTQRPT